MVVLVGLGAAVLLAVGFVLQQQQASQVHATGLRPGLLLVLARHPVWLAGVAAMVAGQLLGATALALGSLVVVEPLLATNVLFALPLGAMASRRRLQLGDWVGAVALVAGLGLLLGVNAPAESASATRVTALDVGVAGGAIAVVVALLVVVARRYPPRVQALLVATAAGATFGLQDFLTQQTLGLASAGVGSLLASWEPWTLVAVALVGLTLSQNAFSAADLSASLPALTLGEPVCGMLLAVTLLHQGLRHEPALLAAGLAGLVLMVAGVVLLARSPLVADPHGHARHGLHSVRRRRRP